MDAQEAELDALFRLPLAELVEARDALVARLRNAGDKAGAARVKTLRRPTPAAWALNQLHFTRPTLLARAREASDEVRALHAQDGVDPRALSAALASQRGALHEVVEAALACCEDAGLPSGVGHQRKLLATLQGVLSGASDEVFGRLTRDVEPAGFDAIAIVGTAAAPGPGPRVPVAVPALVKARSAPDAESERLAAGRARLRECELHTHGAHKRVQEARAALAATASEQATAEARVREAAATLASLRERLAAREAESARLQNVVAEALAAEARARRELDEARAKLLELA